MARRYSRDNRGRFAGGGTGATARGGRLKTASGKTRATQTMQAGGAKASGAIKGKVKRNPDAAGKVGKANVAAKPPAGSQAANKIELAKGRASVMQKQKDSQNKQLKEINAKIKEAGPNAGGLRLQKLQIQSRLQETRSNLAQAKAATKPAKARRQVTETQLGNAAKRAKKVEISRYLSESDRMNAGGKETFAKRSAASQLRAEKGKRTSQAAKAFLSNYGTPSLFGQRPVSSTKDSPMFGAKKRKRR